VKDALTIWLHGAGAAAMGWALVHSVWEIGAVALVVGIVMGVLRRRSPQARYVVGCVGLVAMAALPVGTWWWLLPERAAPVATVAAPEPAAMPVMEARFEPMRMPVAVAAVSRPRTLGERVQAAVEPWLPGAVAAYMAGAGLCWLRLLLGFVRLRQLRRHAVPAPDRLQASLAALAGRLGIARRVRLLESAIVEVPTMLGFLRPVILLPATALTGLSADQLTALLAHELAHVRRYDYLVNVAQSVVETVLFYHPGVWWLSGRVRQEREHCCDDVAVTVAGDRVGYARALATMEGLRASPGQLAMGASGGALLPRIRRLLGLSPRPMPGMAVITGVVAASVLSALLYMGCSREATVQKPQSAATRADAAPAETAPAAFHPAAKGDIMRVSVYELHGPGKEEVQEVPVNERGNVHLLIIGDVHVEGLTPAKIEDRIAEVLVEKQFMLPKGNGSPGPQVVVTQTGRRALLRAVAVGDWVHVKVYDLEKVGELWERDVQVNERGEIPLLNAGRVQVAGMTPAEVEEAIGKMLVEKQFVLGARNGSPGPQVNVIIVEAGGRPMAAASAEETPVAIGDRLERAARNTAGENNPRLELPMATGDIAIMVPPERGQEAVNAPVLELLKKPIPAISADHEGLEKVLDELRTATHAYIQVDWTVLAAAGVRRDAPVTVVMRNRSLEDALGSMMVELRAAKLGYTVDNGCIRISTLEALRQARQESRMADTLPASHLIPYSDRITAGPFSREREDAINKPVVERLEKPLEELSADHLGFEKVIDALRDKAQVNIFVNWKALDGAGIDRDTPVTIDLKNVALRKALTTLLSEAGGTKLKLGYTIDDGIITISTQEDLESAKYQLVKVYDIRDLLLHVTNRSAPEMGQGKGAADIQRTSGRNEEALVPEQERQIKEVVDTIEAIVAPDSWRDKGGHIGTIREVNGQLIVNQTEDHQKEVAAVISQLRESRSIQIAIEARIGLVDEEVFRRLPGVNAGEKDGKFPSVILDEEQLNKALKLVDGSKDSSWQIEPRVTMFNGQRGFIAMTNSMNYIFNCVAKRDEKGNLVPDPEIRQLRYGTAIEIAGTVSADRKSVKVELKPAVTKLLRMETAPAPNTPPGTDFMIQKPVLQEATLQFLSDIADGQTVLLDMGKWNGDLPKADGGQLGLNKGSNDEIKPAVQKERRLFVLVRPTIIIHREIPNDAFGNADVRQMPIVNHRDIPKDLQEVGPDRRQP
jgi:protein involved in polysaccharide export with SLBB domain